MEIAIHCDAGDHWFCYKCIGMSKRLFDAIISEDTPMLFVSCKDCRASSFPMAALKKSSAIEFDEMKQKIEVISKKLDSLKNMEDKVKESFQIIKKHSETSKVNYAEMVKRSVESSEQIVMVKEAVKESAKDHVELEERERSIVIFKRKESKEATGVKRAQEDECFIKDLIDKGLGISSQDIQSSFRLGIFRDNIVRPIKVIFAHKQSQVKVLEHLYRLRDAEADYKAVSVSIDRNLSQREELKKLIKEAEDKSRASEDKRYVVRGTYKPYIIERPA